MIRMTTNYGGVFPRSFAARTPEAAARAIMVQNQMGVYPLSKNQEGRKQFDCEAYTKNKVFAGGVTDEMITADPEVARTQWVVPTRFWKDLEHMLSVNPTVGADDSAMAEQAKVLLALGQSDRNGRRSLTTPCYRPTRISMPPPNTNMSASTLAMAGSGRRTPAYGARTGLDERRRRSYTFL